MKLNPDEQALRALAQISPAVKLMLTNELMSVLDNVLDATDPPLLYQMQGRARLLRELLNLIEQAETGQFRHLQR